MTELKALFDNQHKSEGREMGTPGNSGLMVGIMGMMCSGLHFPRVPLNREVSSKDGSRQDWAWVWAAPSRPRPWCLSSSLPLKGVPGLKWPIYAGADGWSHWPLGPGQIQTQTSCCTAANGPSGSLLQNVCVCVCLSLSLCVYVSLSLRVCVSSEIIIIPL